jgi:hypothetical protein
MDPPGRQHCPRALSFTPLIEAATIPGTSWRSVEPPGRPKQRSVHTGGEKDQSRPGVVYPKPPARARLGRSEQLHLRCHKPGEQGARRSWLRRPALSPVRIFTGEDRYLSVPLHKYAGIRSPLHPRPPRSAPCDVLSEYASVARLAGAAHRHSRCITVFMERDTWLGQQ